MRTGFDISDPGSVAIEGFDVAGGYLGGATPHVWTKDQWHAQPARFRSCFWVLDAVRDPGRQADEAVAMMHDLAAPEGSIIWLDVEGLHQPAAVNAFANRVHAWKFFTGVYGQESTVFSNPPRSGYYVALFDKVGRLYEHPHSIAKQYADKAVVTGGLEADLSVFGDHVPLWDTRPPAVNLRPPWAVSAIDKITASLADLQVARAEIAANAK